MRLGSSTFIQTFSGSEVQKQIAGSHGKMKAVYILIHSVVHSVVRSFVRSFVPLFVCFSFSNFFLFWPTQCTHANFRFVKCSFTNILELFYLTPELSI